MELIPEEIEAYVAAHTTDPHDVFRHLERETREKMERYAMQVGKVEGGLLRMLAQISRARRVLEIGTFTGYSALCLAEGVPDDGEVITCDIDPEATQLARYFWDQHPDGSKITLHLGPALESLEEIDGPFDLVFIDADKENYVRYWEAVMPKLRSGGVVLADNVLWSGRVLNPRDELDMAIDHFNDHVRNDPRVDCVMLTVRDGVTMARKK